MPIAGLKVPYLCDQGDTLKKILIIALVVALGGGLTASFGALGANAETSRASAIKKAYQSVTSSKSKTSIGNVEPVILADSSITKNSIEKIITRYKTVIGFFSNQYIPTNGYVVVLSSKGNLDSYMSLLKQATGFQLDDHRNFLKSTDSQPCSSYTAGAWRFDSLSRPVNSYYLYAPSCPNQLPEAPQFKVTIEHEWVHTIQQVLISDISQVPSWFSEGQANYYGLVLANEKNYTAFLASRKQAIISFHSKAKSLDVLKKLEPSQVAHPGAAGAYSVGALAVEKMLQTWGHAKMIEFMKNISNSVTWQEAFSAVFGIDEETWIAKIAPGLDLERAELLKK